jgi:hypothetical protein
MVTLPKNILYSSGELTKYLILTTEMAIFDVDSKTQNEILEICNNFYNKYKLNLRIYQTSNGYRLFLTNKKFDLALDFKLLMQYTKELNGDTRYIIFNLKKSFGIFTARIAPKKINAQEVSTMIELVNKFNDYKNHPNEGVARYITSIGNGVILEEFKDFITQHDEVSKAFNKNSILI